MDIKLIDKFSAIVEAGEKIAIVGPNGVGKSTLLKCIIGDHSGGLTIDSGECKWSENTKLGFMQQDVYSEFDGNISLTDWISQFGSSEDDDQSIRSILGRLLFSGEDVFKPVNVISGGEKHRMFFGKLMLMKPNVLILDEPTNHLDMESIESLQLALEKYEGTLLVVSHDREFVNSVAKRIWICKENGVIVDFKGSYDEYLNSIN
jgi:ATPase subunit of ABC transporter with duplicated ATPase domains